MPGTTGAAYAAAGTGVSSDPCLPSPFEVLLRSTLRRRPGPARADTADAVPGGPRGGVASRGPADVVFCRSVCRGGASASLRGERPTPRCASDVGSRKRTAFATFPGVVAVALGGERPGGHRKAAPARRDDADDRPSRDPATAGRIARGPYDG